MEELVADAIDLVEVQSETITQVPKALSFPWSGRIHPIGHDIIKRSETFASTVIATRRPADFASTKTSL